MPATVIASNAPVRPAAAFDAAATRLLLPFALLLDALRVAVLELHAGRIRCPERLVVQMHGGALLLSMPAVAADVAVHKLITVTPQNPARGLPSIQGQVSVLDTVTGALQCQLDGPTVTGRRTAAMSMLGIATLLLQPPRHLLLVGTGAQARHHAEAIAALHPAARLSVRGSSLQAAQRFCDAQRALHPGMQPLDGDAASAVADDIDVVITCTSSRVPIYAAPARNARLLVATGAFQAGSAEIASATVLGSTVFVDDPAGARHEGGDLLQAGVDWDTVQPLAQALLDGASHATWHAEPVLFKTVGCAAWDLAAARVALQGLAKGV